MKLTLSTTPRETWVWTDSGQQKEQIEALLADAGCLVLPTSEPHPEPRAIKEIAPAAASAWRLSMAVTPISMSGGIRASTT